MSKDEDDWAKAKYLDTSVLVKMFIEEDGSALVRDYVNDRSSLYVTSLCIAEALGVLKRHWSGPKTSPHKMSDAEYHRAVRGLVYGRWKIDEVSIFSPGGLKAVQERAQKHSLDIADALQLETILQGYFSRLGSGSATILVTADLRLAKAARSEGIRTWYCMIEPQPEWA